MNAVWAILKHYSEIADHSLCPPGKDSWCSYQKDIENGTSLHLPIKNALRPAVVEVITPLFQRLANPTLLQLSKKAIPKIHVEASIISSGL